MKTNEVTLHISKASFMMAGWGLLLLLGGAISQWFNLSADFTLVLWGGITVLGIIAQLVAYVKGLGLNYTFWIFLMVLGWAFTWYVTKFDNGIHADLYGDLAGVWLILLGIGYVATAFQVDKRFFVIAGAHLLVGVLLELSSRRIVTIDILDTYSALIFGLVGGLTLIVASLPVWYRNEQTNQQPQYTMTQGNH
jgi:hypothetical protein